MSSSLVTFRSLASLVLPTSQPRRDAATTLAVHLLLGNHNVAFAEGHCSLQLSLDRLDPEVTTIVATQFLVAFRDGRDYVAFRNGRDYLYHRVRCDLLPRADVLSIPLYPDPRGILVHLQLVPFDVGVHLLTTRGHLVRSPPVPASVRLRLHRNGDHSHLVAAACSLDGDGGRRPVPCFALCGNPVNAWSSGLWRASGFEPLLPASGVAGQGHSWCYAESRRTVRRYLGEHTPFLGNLAATERVVAAAARLLAELGDTLTPGTLQTDVPAPAAASLANPLAPQLPLGPRRLR